MPYAPHALALAAMLFCLGAIGVIVRRNLLFVLMSLEIMLNSAGLAFVAAAAMHSNRAGDPLHIAQADGQAFFIFILPVAAAEVAIGLALAVLLFQRYRTLDLTTIAESQED